MSMLDELREARDMMTDTQRADADKRMRGFEDTPPEQQNLQIAEKAIVTLYRAWCALQLKAVAEEEGVPIESCPVDIIIHLFADEMKKVTGAYLTLVDEEEMKA